MAYKEMGGFPAIVKLAGFDAKYMQNGISLVAEPGAWFEGFVTGEVKIWTGDDGKVTKTLILLGIQMGDGAHVVSRVEGGKFVEHGFEPGEEYALRLSTVLLGRLTKLLRDPAKYEGAKLKITFTKFGKPKKAGYNPAALYVTEVDVTTAHMAGSAAEEPEMEVGPETDE